MTNDNNELKINAPCEEKQEAHKLTEEELEQVSGGAGGGIGFIEPENGGKDVFVDQETIS